MKPLYRALALLSLVATIAPSLLFLAGRIDLPMVKQVMLGATISWFVFAALWIYGKDGAGSPHRPPDEPLVP
jgi:hypothetical protein